MGFLLDLSTGIFAGNGQMKNAIITDSEMLQHIQKSNTAINDAIEKAMNARSSQKHMSNIEA